MNAFDTAVQAIKTGGNVIGAFRSAFAHSMEHLQTHRNLTPLASFADAVMQAPVRPKGATLARLREVLDERFGKGTLTLKTERNGTCTLTLTKGANLPAFDRDSLPLSWWEKDESAEDDKVAKTDAQRLMEALERFSKKNGKAELTAVLVQFDKVQELKAALETALKG